MVNDPLSNGPRAINFFTVKLLQLSGIALTTRTDVKVRVNPFAVRDNFQSAGQQLSCIVIRKRCGALVWESTKRGQRNASPTDGEISSQR